MATRPTILGHGHSLRAWLAEEEARYVVALQERLEFIKSGARGKMPLTREY
jgi:hypothetical protein